MCQDCHTEYPFAKQLYLQMFPTMSHWSVWSPLVSATLSILGPHLDFSWVSHCALYHGDLEALVTQDLPLHVLQQVIDGVDVGVSQLKALDLGLCGS